MPNFDQANGLPLATSVVKKLDRQGPSGEFEIGASGIIGGITTGTQPNYLLTYDFDGESWPRTAYKRGLRVTAKIHAVNAGGAATLGINGISPASIRNPDGSELSANQLQIREYEFRYDESNTYFVLVGDHIHKHSSPDDGGGILAPLRHQLTKGADVSSAAALNLGADGNYFDVTGANPITSINTLGVATVIMLHFDAALTLTHHATDLILPGGDDILTNAGDEYTFIEYATGDWRLIGGANFGLKVTVGSFTRDTSLASSQQTIAGVGFRAKAVILFTGQSVSSEFSWGFDTVASRQATADTNTASANTYETKSVSIFLEQGSGVSYSGVVDTFDPDGFKVGWTKTGASVGTATVNFLAFG